jgi:hypothetical protein
MKEKKEYQKPNVTVITDTKSLVMKAKGTADQGYKYDN